MGYCTLVALRPNPSYEDLVGPGGLIWTGGFGLRLDIISNSNMEYVLPHNLGAKSHEYEAIGKSWNKTAIKITSDLSCADS